MHANVIDLNACQSNPCENRGRCEQTAQGFQCKCSGNFGGLTCTRRYYAIKGMCVAISIGTYSIAHAPRTYVRKVDLYDVRSIPYKLSECCGGETKDKMFQFRQHKISVCSGYLFQQNWIRSNYLMMCGG